MLGELESKNEQVNRARNLKKIKLTVKNIKAMNNLTLNQVKEIKKKRLTKSLTSLLPLPKLPLLFTREERVLKS